MALRDDIIALDLPLPDRNELPEDMQKYFSICDEKLGMLPNVLAAYSHDAEQLRTFSKFYSTLMLGDSGLSLLERTHMRKSGTLSIRPACIGWPTSRASQLPTNR